MAQHPADRVLAALSLKVGRYLAASGHRLACAESCTGGWIAKAITDIPGSSDWFEQGFVTYSNPAKIRALNVDMNTLKRHGAVSEAVVREMAQGAIEASGADVAVAVSGIAGPGGGTQDKPVGLVWFCWARRQGKRIRLQTTAQRFRGDRYAVRAKTVARALRGILKF